MLDVNDHKALQHIFKNRTKQNQRLMNIKTISRELKKECMDL